jgi:hypothetical protein
MVVMSHHEWIHLQVKYGYGVDAERWPAIVMDAELCSHQTRFSMQDEVGLASCAAYSEGTATPTYMHRHRYRRPSVSATS